MDERQLNQLVENELYKYILALSEDEMENVTLEKIEEGILWFLLQYDEKITKPQRKLIVQKIWKMFENKNKYLAAKSREDYDEDVTRFVEGIEI